MKPAFDPRARPLQLQEAQRLEHAQQVAAAVRQWTRFGHAAGSVADEYSPYRCQLNDSRQMRGAQV